MNICFSGFDGDIEVRRGVTTVLEVSNRTLFSRVYSSIATGAGDLALEPYVVWGEDGKEKKSANTFLLAADPMKLPWDDRAMAGALASRYEEVLFEDETVRLEVETAFSALRSRMVAIALQLQSDYSFGVDWDAKRYLKSFGFGVELSDNDLLIDRIIKFLLLAEDVQLKKAIVFVNLKLFLTEIDLKRFFDQVFFSNLAVLMLETIHDGTCYNRERKYIIDQDLLEIWPSDSISMPVSPQ